MTSALVPFVSVLMPVRNEATFIRTSLGAVLSQDYPSNRMEIIVADGMSTDATRQIIADVQRQHPNVRLVDNPGSIVSTGLNSALGVASGDVIVRVDGHTVIAPDYVTECVDALVRTGADNVGGRMNPQARGLFAEAVALATSSPFGVGGARFHYSEREEWVDTAYLGAWPREVFDKIGCFDEELVRDQDDEFNYRLRKQGGRILLSPRIRSTYYPRVTAYSLWRQYFQYGYWKVRVLQKHPVQMRPRQFVPPLLVATLLVGAWASLWSRLGRALLTLAGCAYLLANTAVSLRAAKRAGWRHLRWLPAVFVILHGAYGSGFLRGLVRFRGRWRSPEPREQQP